MELIYFILKCFISAIGLGIICGEIMYRLER